MTIIDIRQQFRDGSIDATEALKLAAPFVKNGKTKGAAEAFINEVLGMPAEPQEMTAKERDAAKNWETNYRSE
jgi:uncharacterized membrane protein YebE (DUF533 family)